MTEAMPFLQKVILLSYDPRPLAGGHDFWYIQSCLCVREGTKDLEGSSCPAKV